MLAYPAAATRGLGWCHRRRPRRLLLLSGNCGGMNVCGSTEWAAASSTNAAPAALTAGVRLRATTT